MPRVIIIDEIVDLLKEQGREMHVTEIAHLMGEGATRNQVSNALNHRLENTSAKQVDIARVRRGVWMYVEPEVEVTPKPRPLPRQREQPKPAMPTLLEVLGMSSEFELIARDPDTGKIYKASLM